MLFSERQIHMAIALAKVELDQDKILLAVQLDRKDELNKSPLHVHLQEEELAKHPLKINTP